GSRRFALRRRSSMFNTRGDWTELDRRFIEYRATAFDFHKHWALARCNARKSKNRFNGFFSGQRAYRAAAGKPPFLMPEMTYASEYHRHLARVSGSNHFFVTHRAARLNRTGCTGFGRRDQPVREREKRVTSDRAALQRKASLVRFPNCNPRRIDTR